MRLSTIAFITGLALAPSAFSVTALAETTTQTPAALVSLNDDILIEGDLVYLGDIFSGLEESADTPIARAPELGRVVDLSAQWLWALARQYDVNWRPSSHLDTASVRRASATLPSDEVKGSIEKALIDQGLSPSMRLDFDRANAAINIPLEVEPTLKVESISYRTTSGRFTARVAIPAEGQPYLRKTITGRLIEMIEIPVLRARLSKGDVITAEDIEWREVPKSKLARNAIADLDAVIGMTPRQTIRPGEAIRTSDLDTPKAVHKNGLVTMLLEHGTLNLSTQGRALESGALGETVRVMNTQSNTIVNGTVTGQGLVQVSLLNNTIGN